MSWPTCMTLYFDELNCNNHQIVLTSFDDCRDHSVIPAHPPLSWSYTKLLYHQQTSAYCLLSNLEDHSRTVKTVAALELTPCGTPLMTSNHPEYRPRTPTLILLPVGNWQSNSHTCLKYWSCAVWAVVDDAEQCRNLSIIQVYDINSIAIFQCIHPSPKGFQ